jgi:hypothetical protein
MDYQNPWSGNPHEPAIILDMVQQVSNCWFRYTSQYISITVVSPYIPMLFSLLYHESESISCYPIIY